MDAMLANGQVSVVILMALSAALFIALSELARSYFVTKRAELKLADEARERHFLALHKLIGNDDEELVSHEVKRFLLQFSAAICTKAIAKRIAQGIKSRKKPKLCPERQHAVEALMGEISLMVKQRPDLADALVDVINFGFAAMVLRWPETEIMMARALMLDAEVKNDGIRQKATCVFAQVDDQTLAVGQGAIQAAVG